MKISVIMSTYKTPKNQLKESINSILNQTFEDFEFIITVDGDIDNYRIISEIRDERIVIINNPTNIGLARSLNKMIDIAKGEYIARMDADDISRCDRFKKQIEFLESNRNYDICASYAKIIGKSKYIVSINDYDELKCKLLFKNTIVHPSIMIRKSFLEKEGIRYNDKYLRSQDFELYTRIKNLTKIYVYPEVLFFYRDDKKRTLKHEKWIYHENIIKKNIFELGLDNKVGDFLLYLDNYPYAKKIYSISRSKELISIILNANLVKDIYKQEKLEDCLMFYLFKKKTNENLFSSIRLFKLNYLSKIIKIVRIYVGLYIKTHDF